MWMAQWFEFVSLFCAFCIVLLKLNFVQYCLITVVIILLILSTAQFLSEVLSLSLCFFAILLVLCSHYLGLVFMGSY